MSHDLRAADRFSRSLNVLIRNLNHYCSGNQQLAFRYVSSFWDKMQSKYEDVSFSNKLRELENQRIIVEEDANRDIYQLFLYFLAKENELGLEISIPLLGSPNGFRPYLLHGKQSLRCWRKTTLRLKYENSRRIRGSRSQNKFDISSISSYYIPVK